MEKHIFEALYKEYFSLVFRQCLRFLRNYEDAENAANTVFENLYKRDDVIFFPKSYLRRMAANTGLKEIKKNKREAAYVYAEATNISISRLKEKGEVEIKQLLRNKMIQANTYLNEIFDDSYDQIEAEMVIEAVLKEEDAMTKVIYSLCYHDDMTYNEIGEVIGISKSAVEKRIRKLEKKIKQKITGSKNER